MRPAITALTWCRFSGLMCRMSSSRRLRPRILNLALRLEGGEFFSATARWILQTHHGVKIGDYSYGECFALGSFPSGVIVGRYVSIGRGVRVFLRNHPSDRLSMHPFFYNFKLGFVPKDTIESSGLIIEHDAWIGSGAFIVPGCSRIGIGAVIGAGAIVTKDVPDFGVAVGNPARVIRHRFDREVCRTILDSRWWERPANECIQHMSQMTVPLVHTLPNHPLLRSQ